jgi:hypothetical protein
MIAGWSAWPFLSILQDRLFSAVVEQEPANLIPNDLGVLLLSIRENPENINTWAML